MKTMTTCMTFARWMAIASVAALMAGCGGGGGGGGGDAQNEERAVAFGPLLTRIVGTAQPAVTSSGFGAVVTGVAGATISSMVLQDNSQSLDDTLIAFRSARDGNDEIYVMSPNGSNQTRLTSNTAFDGEPVFSPAGGRIAFRSARDGGQELYSMNTDGSNVARLTNNTSFDGEPSFSPGSVFVAFRTDRDGNSEVYTQREVGTVTLVGRLTNNAAFDGQPEFSPDGKKIAFISTRTGKSQIFLMNADGTNQTALGSGFNDVEPAWSPDGSKIAFRSDRAGTGSNEIFVMNVNGTNPNASAIRLTFTGFSANPVFSPDGSKIAFRSNRDGSTINSDIYVMNANGTNQIRLTTTGFNFDPSWSPFLTKRILLGTNAQLGTEAAGFLFSQRGKSIPAVVTFDATTRSAARVAAQTPASATGPNLVFEVSAADSLTSLRYLIGAAPIAINVIGATGAVTSATNALVSFDSSDGTVTSVLPYTANRSASSPADTIREGGALVYRRNFLGVWDGTGRNVAPAGAHEVRIDAKTGRLLSFK